jgi:hypothetical protein
MALKLAILLFILSVYVEDFFYTIVAMWVEFCMGTFYFLADDNESDYEEFYEKD